MDAGGEYRMRYKYLLIMMCIILLPFVTSQMTYQQDTVVDLKVPCYNNNTYCASTAECNITIIQYNGSVIVNNLLMTNNVAYHNITLGVEKTATSGEYTSSVVCNDNGLLGKSTFYYIITPTGKSSTTSSAITQGLVLLMMFGVTIFFLVFAKVTENPSIKLFFNIIGYITIILSVGTAYILLQNSEVQSNLSSTVEYLLFIVGIVFVIIMFYILIQQTRRTLQLFRIKKGLGSEYDDTDLF